MQPRRRPLGGRVTAVRAPMPRRNVSPESAAIYYAEATGTIAGMSDTPLYRLYRVVAIRPNGLRVPMGFGMTSEEARRVREALVEANVFGSVTIEEDTESGAAPPRQLVP